MFGLFRYKVKWYESGSEVVVSNGITMATSLKDATANIIATYNEDNIEKITLEYITDAPDMTIEITDEGIKNINNFFIF